MAEEKEMNQEAEAAEEIKDEETVSEEAEAKSEETEETPEAEETTETEEVNTEEASEDTEETGSKKKKERDLGWTKKAKEKARKAEEEKEKIEAKIAEANDKYARLFAEFDNFRKRTDKEKSQMFGMGAKDVLEKILPIVDSFERGLTTVPEDKKEDAFVVGMDKVYKQFLQILENMGVTPIEAVGKEFDPNIHNAVMHVDDDTVGENIIVEEFQKGYMYKESLLRPSMVKVAN